MILNNDSVFVEMSKTFVVKRNDSFRIINTPDFFDKECLHPDQMTIDFMALSYPGPELFILAIDSENTQDEEVKAQISKLQDTFGDKILAHLVIMLPDKLSFESIDHLKPRFTIRWAFPNQNLASEVVFRSHTAIPVWLQKLQWRRREKKKNDRLREDKVETLLLHNSLDNIHMYRQQRSHPTWG